MPSFDMQDHSGGPATRAVTSMLFMTIGCTALAGLLSSCSADMPLQREASRAEAGALPVQHSIVCIIHGDGDYLYHDTSGSEYDADEEALAAVEHIAQQNPRAEVFIFHQKPRRHLLFLFPLHDGEFTYYRHGIPVATESYWRDQERPRFAPEVELFQRYRAIDGQKRENLFLYFGHEIPERGGLDYDASSPERSFTVDDLAEGLRGFTRDSGPFGLMVLSTCFGGTPYTIGALGPFARQIIASPDNLHLSYFDLRSLERLDLSVGEGDTRALARRFAHQAFDRLAEDIETAVSVALYDVERVQEFVRSVHRIYDSTLTVVKGTTAVSMAAIEHCDCAEVPAYILPTMNEGVELLYRPPHFGRSKNKARLSGWECWREREPQAATSRTARPMLK